MLFLFRKAFIPFLKLFVFLDDAFNFTASCFDFAKSIYFISLSIVFVCKIELEDTFSHRLLAIFSTFLSIFSFFIISSTSPISFAFSALIISPERNSFFVFANPILRIEYILTIAGTKPILTSVNPNFELLVQ